MKISVVLVTYNRIHYLPRALDSLLGQTFNDFELILVNNGSTDGSDALCHEYAQKDNRIRLIEIPQNQGASRGRNKGIDAVSCDYLTFVDDDDVCESGMLEHLWKLARNHDADIAVCGSWNDFGDRLEPYFIFDELLVLGRAQGLDELLKREKYTVAPPTKLFRTSLFNNIRFPEHVLVDDIHVIYKVFANASKVAAQGIPLYRFTKHEGNMTGFIQSNILSAPLLEEYLSMYHERTECLTARVPEITSRARYSEWSYMISMCDKIQEGRITECMYLYDKMIHTIRNNLQEFSQSPFLTSREEKLINKYVLPGSDSATTA